MIKIDGSFGEGGGQILRTSLALSLVTGKPVTLEKIRAGRAKPGLMRQHLTAVKAAAEIGGATVSGNEPGSQSLVFTPGQVKAGKYRFAIGTAGSCTLVLQTVLPALLVADGPSELELEGGTHNMMAPPFDFLAQTFLPLLQRMGIQVEAELVRPGFYPAGGGLMRVRITPVTAWKQLELLERGAIVRREAVAMMSKLSNDIGQRELKKLQALLGLTESEVRLERVANSPGPGNVVRVAITSECGVTEVVSGFGKLGVTAEQVAMNVAAEAQAYLTAEVPVGQHLADQLLLPMAMAGGGSFRTMALTAHTETNLQVIRKFLPIRAETVTEPAGTVLVRLF
jgi:RNA 3'-terminal phosphate cyclase (ATP)